MRRGIWAVGAVLMGLAGWWLFRTKLEPIEPVRDAHVLQIPSAPESDAQAGSADSTVHDAIRLPRDFWPAAGVELAKVARGDLARTIELTGKIALNEDRVAHIFPLVEGRVHEVNVQFGDRVRRGDRLVVVESREVGQAMLTLYQHRVERDAVLAKDRWVQKVAKNTSAMLELIRNEATIEEIERQLMDRPLGEFRERLMGAYIAHYKAKKQLDRLSPLHQEGTVTGKQMLEAEAEWNAARATLRSLVEQIQQDSERASLLSTQSVRELETHVAVAETNLEILGFDADALRDIQPAEQRQSLSHYPIYAPFDGTIISKDVVLLERVAPDRQILGIADLSTVWVTADLYEDHLTVLKSLKDQELTVRAEAWPDRTFQARVFYTGDMVQEGTRTISLRAAADNRERLLKPGMFVRVEFPASLSANVMQVPASAVQEHAGRTFVFVYQGGDLFERRDVVLGQRKDDVVEIVSGVEPGAEVVSAGGFALKSQMLADLLEE
jgi:cobalt-zinc-cadmium efflux system membrane fusion protein